VVRPHKGKQTTSNHNIMKPFRTLKNLIIPLCAITSTLNAQEKSNRQLELQTTNNANNNGKNGNNSPPVLRCGSSKIDIDVPKAFLNKHNIIVRDSAELHFAKHKDCFAVDNGDSYKLQIFAPFDSCGTTVEHGSDDYAYTNEVVFANKDKSLSVFQFRCIYEDKYIVSSGPISPTKRTLQFSSGEGEFEVSMEMYRGPSFSFMDKHADNPTVRLNDPVYVDVEFTSNLGFGDPGRELVTSIKTCYATDTPNHADHKRYHNLISGMCVSPEDPSVEILENGNSDNARFKFNMFKWKGVIAYIYLHCEVHLCNSTIETCRNDQKMCHNRNQRKRKRRGITLPVNIDRGYKKSRAVRQTNQSRKYTIEADMGEYDDNIQEIGESVIDYKDLSSSDYQDLSNSVDYTNVHDIHGMLDSSFYDNFPDEPEMTDFITRGPILFDDIENSDVGSGQINSTIVEIYYNDEFLRVYIFSSIAIVICVIAMILAILLALKRRKAGLEKMADIDHVFSGFRQSIDGSYGGQTGSASSAEGGNTKASQKIINSLTMSDDNLKVLPAITGLPLPPTPEVPSNLPPVLGSPMTTASNISNSNNNTSLDNSDGSDIYHNIVPKSVTVSHKPSVVRHTSSVNPNGNHKPIQQKMSLQHHPSHHNNIIPSSNSMVVKSTHNNLPPLRSNTFLSKTESSRLQSRPTLTLPHSSHNLIHHNQGQSVQLHHHSHTPGMHGGNRVERSKTSINPNTSRNVVQHQQSFSIATNNMHMKHPQHSQSYNMSHSSTHGHVHGGHHQNSSHHHHGGVGNGKGLKHSQSQLQPNRKVETNTISHTLSNYSN
jgi:hypothetical protein